MITNIDKLQTDFKQGDHSPDTLKFPDQCVALMPMLSGTHSMSVLLVN